MDIYWYGQSCFRLKGKTSSVVIDPFLPDFIGLKLPKDLQADVVLQTHNHQDHNNTSAVSGSPMVFSGPGEYEIKGIVLTGVASFHDDQQGTERGLNTIFHINMDGINIVHLGDLGQSKLTEEQLNEIGQTDILLIPVGGVYTIDAQNAANIIAQLEPRVIIPMHYSIEGLRAELQGVDSFVKQMGIEQPEELAKFTATKDKLPDEPQLIVLKIA